MRSCHVRDTQLKHNSCAQWYRVTPCTMLNLGLSCLLLLLLRVFVAFGTELTFELPDNDKQCFYEELEENLRFDIDYQVS